MSVVLGAILPTLFGSIVALPSFVVRRSIGLPIQPRAGSVAVRHRQFGQ